MLILARRVGERIKIGENVFITLTDIEGKQAKLGIEAPQEINIVREELLERKKINKSKEDS